MQLILVRMDPNQVHNLVYLNIFNDISIYACVFPEYFLQCHDNFNYKYFT